MLTVNTCFAPNNRRGFVFYRHAVKSDLFAVAFHTKLLDELGQAVQVLVVGGDNMAAAAVVVDIPNAYHGE